MSRTVAILGASNDRSKFGNKAYRAFIDQGWKVYPVNPKETEIEGDTCYPNLAALPERVERITVYTPPPVTLSLLPEIAEANPDEVYFNPGSESAQVYEKSKELGISAIFACSILNIGAHPGLYGDD
jgi:predicted CoA-binding protein